MGPETFFWKKTFRLVSSLSSFSLSSSLFFFVVSLSPHLCFRSHSSSPSSSRPRLCPCLVSVHETGGTPPIQYVDNVVDVPAGLRRQEPNHQDITENRGGCTGPVHPQDRGCASLCGPTIQTTQNTLEVHQVQFIDLVVGIPVVQTQRPNSTIQTVQKTLDASQVQFVDRVVRHASRYVWCPWL